MRHNIANITLMIMSMALSFPAQAVVLTATAPVTTPEVNIGSGSSATMVWNVTRSPVAGPGAVVSSRGIFKVGGNPVATTNRSLTRNFSNGTVSTVFNITENVVVPRSVIIEAQRQGAPLSYEREFTDDNLPFLGDEVTLIVGGSSSTLGVAELELTFEDGDFYRTVGLKEKLYAVAHLSLSGTGNFRAVWELADESGATDQPFWRPLRHLNRPIGGSPDIAIKSPPLPTETLGRHRVRLRLIEPADSVSEQPILNYFVSEDGHGELPAFTPQVPARDGGGMGRR